MRKGTKRITVVVTAQSYYHLRHLADMAGYGDIVRYGRPLFGSVEDERFPLPVIIPQCLTGEDIDTVTFDNFGKQVKLYLHERRVE